MLPRVTILKSKEEESRELTEPPKCLYSAIFYTGKEIILLYICIESAFGIGPYISLGVGISIGKEEIVSQHL